MSKRIICIATWGNPAGWDCKEYIFNEDSDCGKTSLRIIKRKINPDMTILVGLDTLAREGSSYEEIRRSAENVYSDYLKEFGLTVDRMIIAPGVGDFRDKIFIGDMSDFYAYVMCKLEEFLPAGEDLELHLDLTHGINFMPALTYRAVRELAEIIPAKVRLFVYNSDPFSKEASYLRVNLVESDEIPWRPSLNKLSNSLELLRPIDLSESEREELFRYELKKYGEVKKKVKELNAFTGSVVNGLPLALFRFYPETELLDECIKEVMMFYNRYIMVSKEDGKIKVKRRLSLGRDFPSLIKLILTAKILKELGIEKKNEVELEKLNELKDNIFHRNKRIEVMISNDLHKIEERKRDVTDDWKKLKEFLGYKGGYDSRNFLAHSGLEENAVEIRREGNRVMLRYCDDMIDRVIEDSAIGLISWE